MSLNVLRAMVSLTLIGLGVSVVGSLAGCANVPYIAGEAAELKEATEIQTGSNLARRGKGGSDARVIDKDSMEQSIRAVNPNAGSGRTQL